MTSKTKRLKMTEDDESGPSGVSTTKCQSELDNTSTRVNNNKSVEYEESTVEQKVGGDLLVRFFKIILYLLFTLL